MIVMMMKIFDGIDYDDRDVEMIMIVMMMMKMFYYKD